MTSAQWSPIPLGEHEQLVEVIASLVEDGRPAWWVLSPALFRIWCNGLEYGVNQVAEPELQRRIRELNDEADGWYFMAQYPTPEARAEWAKRRIEALDPADVWRAENAIRLAVAERDDRESFEDVRRAA